MGLKFKFQNWSWDPEARRGESEDSQYISALSPELLCNPSKLQMDTKLWRVVVQPARTRGTSDKNICMSIALLVLTCWTGLNMPHCWPGCIVLCSLQSGDLILVNENFLLQIKVLSFPLPSSWSMTWSLSRCIWCSMFIYKFAKFQEPTRNCFCMRMFLQIGINSQIGTTTYVCIVSSSSSTWQLWSVNWCRTSWVFIYSGTCILDCQKR